MKDRRFVDDLSLEELERILLVKRREARLARLRQMDRADHALGRDPLESHPPLSVAPPIPTGHRRFNGIGASASYRAVEVEEGGSRFSGLWLTRWLAEPMRIKWNFVVRGILLLVETAAVVGLILVVASTRQNQEKIDEDVEDVFVPPTPTTAPLINAVVLPGGHTPPDARGFSQPEPMLEFGEAALPQPAPTLGPEHAVRIVIPSIAVDHPVVEGDDWEALKRGVGHIPWSANPGQAGNCILTAHNDIFGEIFRRLPEAKLGDEVFVHSGIQVHRYVVKATRIVEPTQVELMYPTNDPYLTLISSYPYLVDNKRIVVIAALASSPNGDG